jgi:hypothetical protein
MIRAFGIVLPSWAQRETESDDSQPSVAFADVQNDSVADTEVVVGNEDLPNEIQILTEPDLVEEEEHDEMMIDIGRQLENCSSVDSNLTLEHNAPFRVSCMAHQIQLVVKDGLKLVEVIDPKISFIQTNHSCYVLNRNLLKRLYPSFQK